MTAAIKVGRLTRASGRYSVGQAQVREQFEVRTHKRLLDIFEPTPQTVDALM